MADFDTFSEARTMLTVAERRLPITKQSAARVRAEVVGSGRLFLYPASEFHADADTGHAVSCGRSMCPPHLRACWMCSATATVLKSYSQSFMATKPDLVREYPPPKDSLVNRSFSLISSKVSSSRTKLGPEKHNICPGVIRYC